VPQSIPRYCIRASFQLAEQNDCREGGGLLVI